MPKYRSKLPQLNGDLFITDGGIETTMMFKENIDLPYLAAFTLLDSTKGKDLLTKYFDTYCQIATKYKVGLILEAVTWRASLDWAIKLGYSKNSLDELLRKSIEFFEPFRSQFENRDTKIVFSGCIGPRGDGYMPGDKMSVIEAQSYHSMQIETFSKTNVDMLTVLTLNYVEEAVGIARAADAYNMPAVISFTVETDGNLPTGQSLKEAIEQVETETNQAPIYYKINCAHPTHFKDAISTGDKWLEKIHSVRANASSCSHAELDEAEELDSGNPDELAQQYLVLKKLLPNLNVLGGCCGTDSRHIEAICKTHI